MSAQSFGRPSGPLPCLRHHRESHPAEASEGCRSDGDSDTRRGRETPQGCGRSLHRIRRTLRVRGHAIRRSCRPPCWRHQVPRQGDYVSNARSREPTEVHVEIRAPKYESVRTVYAPDGLLEILSEHIRLHLPDNSQTNGCSPVKVNTHSIRTRSATVAQGPGRSRSSTTCFTELPALLRLRADQPRAAMW